MSSTTLGAKLAATIADEQAFTLQAARLHARALSEEARAELQAVEDFYAKAKKHFIEGIQACIPSVRLGILVGRTPNKQDNTAIYNLLKLYNQQAVHAINKPGHPFYAPTKDFEEWAKAEGLAPRWRNEHDGVGVHSWWILTVEPLV